MGSTDPMAGEPATAAVVQTVLPGGARLLELAMPGRLATTVSIALPAGARHEREGETGAAHLLEHLVFKGTQTHASATELNRAAEYLGTELDGVTSDDSVELGTSVRGELAMGAIALLIDVVARPLCRPQDLELERAIVLTEIAEGAEEPATRAEQRLRTALFGDHRLGVATTGAAEAVSRLAHERVLAFGERQWSPHGALVTVAGNLEHVERERVIELLEALPPRAAPPPPPPPPPFARRVEVEEHDAATVQLRLAYSLPELRLGRRRTRAAAEVFSQLLGGPMGSRLFDELRERRGLCYWIDGSVWGFEESAYLSIGCSVQEHDLPEAFERIEAIVDDLRRNGPTAEEAQRAHIYASSAVALDFDSIGGRVDHAVELVMDHGDYDVDPATYLAEVDAVGRGELAEVCAQIRPGPCVGAVGPLTAADVGG